jgi:hypothetical protein
MEAAISWPMCDRKLLLYRETLPILRRLCTPQAQSQRSEPSLLLFKLPPPRMPSRSCSETQCSVNDAAKSEHSLEKDAETIVTSVDQALPLDGGLTAWLTLAGS